MHKVAVVDIEDFSQPTEVFSQPDEFDPMDLVTNKTTPAENHRDNGAKLPHGTQPFFLHYYLRATKFPLLRSCIDAAAAAAAACLAITSELTTFCLEDADNTLFSVYQDWVLQHTYTRLDGGMFSPGLS